MACGTPVVVSDTAGIADIVAAPAAGRIVTRITPEKLADAIRDLLAAPSARAATRAHAEQFDWQCTTDGQIALFGEVCAQHRGGAAMAGTHRRKTRP
jgi:glycosyltransferase involved in cell wall biosynthesis